MKIHKSKNLHTLYTVLMAFLLICIVMGIGCYQYYKQLQDTVQEESGGYLQEISKLLGDNASGTINDNFSVLGTVASVLKSSKVSTYDEFGPIATQQQKSWGYQDIYLIDGRGIAYDSTGKSIVFGGEEFLQDAIVNNKPAMSSSMVLEGKDSVIFVIPVNDLVVEGIEIRGLAASYDLATFDQILSMSAFGGEAYAHITRRDGSVVIRSSSQNAPDTSYNILNTLSNATMDAGSDFETLKADIAAGKSGMVSFSIDDTRNYMAYTPLVGQQWSLLTFVPVSVVNAKSELMLNLTLLLCGLVTLAFAILTVFLALSFYRHRNELEKIAYIDPITGGNTIQRFYEATKDLLKNFSGQAPYAIIYMNIEKFKVLNDQFGRKACDELLRGIHHGMVSDMSADECVGRQYADNFCILVRYESEAALVARFSKWRNAAIEYITANGSTWMPQSAEFGVYVIDNVELPLAHMIDRAKLSLAENTCTLNDKMRYAIYDEKVRSILLREKQLEDMMEDALKNNEFEVYLQPKYNTQTETIGGAEALVRWKTRTEGMIYPDEFIPLFEKNGFVVKVDLFVFEEVCRTLERWEKEGRTPIKISVNCSRVHLKTPHFLDQYRHIAEKYTLPANVLELELTESAVFEDVETLSSVIREIHSLGFGCSMDDFGSGYSSLNLIREIPVDTLKLDKIFFHTGSVDSSRTKSVVNSIITMAKALHMSTVAEGVEEREQVDMLKQLQCSYIQGYYFAKPMPIPQFEQHLDEDIRIGQGKEKERKEEV